jgi:quinol-cytochrome oxidoreductase complex cytochrome b subunit
VKDIWLCLLIAVSLVAFPVAFALWADSALEADNYISADRLHTPGHIVPEWYLLSAYTMLRAST